MTFKHTPRFTERATAVPNKQGHVSAPPPKPLIPIRVTHKQLHPLHTPAIHPKAPQEHTCSQTNSLCPQHATFKKEQTPTWETQWLCFYGGTGCGEGWRARVTPARLFTPYFWAASRQEEVRMMQYEHFPKKKS